MSPSSLVLSIKYPLKHCTALHRVNTKPHNIKIKGGAWTPERVELLVGSAGSAGLLTESDHQPPQSWATRRAQHLVPPATAHPGLTQRAWVTTDTTAGGYCVQNTLRL